MQMMVASELNIIFIRHGQAMHNLAPFASPEFENFKKTADVGWDYDPPLTREGWLEAKMLSRRLGIMLSEKSTGNVRVLSSPLIRCLQTVCGVMTSLTEAGMPTGQIVAVPELCEIGRAQTCNRGSSISSLRCKFPNISFPVDKFKDGCWDSSCRNDLPKKVIWSYLFDLCMQSQDTVIVFGHSHWAEEVFGTTLATGDACAVKLDKDWRQRISDHDRSWWKLSRELTADLGASATVTRTGKCQLRSITATSKSVLQDKISNVGLTRLLGQWSCLGINIDEEIMRLRRLRPRRWTESGRARLEEALDQGITEDEKCRSDVHTHVDVCTERDA